nr:hypothetical protein [Candidatus Sigynarchaeota archaeon]
MAFDYIFKLVMKELLASCDAKAEKVGTLPLEIDTVARCKAGAQSQVPIPLLAKQFATDNLFEYKSEGNMTRKEDLSKLLGYVGLYGDQNGIGFNEMRGRITAWYISAKRPGFLDKMLTTGIAVASADAGVYEVVTGFPCPCRVVVCDELDVNDGNVPLLVLGSIETVKKAIVHIAHAGSILRNTMRTIISLIYYMYHDKVKDMTEMDEIIPPDMLQSMKHAIEDIGIEAVLKVLDINKVIDAVGVDKLKEAIARKEAGQKKPVKRVKRSS